MQSIHEKVFRLRPVAAHTGERTHRGRDQRKESNIMNSTPTTRKLLAGVGVAAAAVVTPALLFVGAATAHADDGPSCPAYNQGYHDGSWLGVGKCLVDTAQQPAYDKGFGDARAGLPSMPPAYWPPTNTGLNPNIFDPTLKPQDTMGPWDGRTGSEPGEMPERIEPPEPIEPYEPEPVD